MQIVATTPVINGDYNDDGKVDAADYVRVAKYGGTTAELTNDPTGGTIDAADIHHLAGQLRQPPAAVREVVEAARRSGTSFADAVRAVGLGGLFSVSRRR